MLSKLTNSCCWCSDNDNTQNSHYQFLMFRDYLYFLLFLPLFMTWPFDRHCDWRSSDDTTRHVGLRRRTAGLVNEVVRATTDTDLYEIRGVRPQGQRDARGVREQVALKSAADDFPRDQIGGPVHLPGVPRHLGDHQHLLMDHGHFPQVPHLWRVIRRRVVSLKKQNARTNGQSRSGRGF